MRTRTFIVLQLLACAYICSGQNKKTFGTDPASIICFKEVRINAGYAFGRKWSANADISIYMGNTSERWDEREAAHWLELYGKDKAKITNDFIKRNADKKDGKLILVTAINPTPAGEGKTTITVGLGQAMNKIGKNA